uniref:Uncharacterized protein n=1 Tax=Panagrolaimus sp. ES5 TaxID=591445 RepID=A0AC34F2P6_9BILA
MRRPSTSSTTRRKSIVEAAEQHFDKNTIILCVNVIILMVLMGILYMVATSAMNVSGGNALLTTVFFKCIFILQLVKLFLIIFFLSLLLFDD